MEILNTDTTLAPIDAVTPHPENPRQGDVGAIHESIRHNGFWGSVVVQRSTGYILAGNHRWQAAKAAGATEIPITYVDVTDEHAARILLADNRTNDLATYNDQALADLLTSLADTTGTLDGTGYDGDDLDDLLTTLGHDTTPPAESGDVVGRAEELQAQWQVQPGQLWQAGPHRIAAGDSNDQALLDRLIAGQKVGCILTDPPYGMNLDTDYSDRPGGGRTAKMHRRPNTYKPVIGDDAAFDAAPLRAYFRNVKEQFWFGADYYRGSLSPDDRDGSWLVWDKRKEDGSQDDVIGSTFELVWSAQRHQRRILRHYWTGAFGSSEARARYHPTQKPVPMLREILRRWAPPRTGGGGPVSGFRRNHDCGASAGAAKLRGGTRPRLCSRDLTAPHRAGPHPGAYRWLKQQKPACTTTHPAARSVGTA